MAQKFFEKAGVQGALVGGFLALLGIPLTLWIQSQLDGPRLRADNEQLRTDLTKKTADLQLLQTKFAPFEVMAIQNFTGTEAERLSKLALKLNDIQKGLDVLSSEQALIKEKTGSIASLPDGRLKMGSLVTGEPTILITKAREMATAYDAHDYPKTYELASIVMQLSEDAEKATDGASISTSQLNPAWLAEVGRIASDGARLTKHFEQAVAWARRSVKYEDSGARRAALVLSLLAADNRPEADEIIRQSLTLDSKITQEFRETMKRVGLQIP